MQQLTDILKEPMASEEDAIRWARELHAQELAWHFDDDPTDCLENVVSKEDAELLGKQRDHLIFLHNGCVHELMLNIMKVSDTEIGDYVEFYGSQENQLFGVVTAIDAENFKITVSTIGLILERTVNACDVYPT